ncbi:MAG: N-formylglutamate deformylase [Pararhodobacter sp.]|nr:N-formylglutamate deformylase [Pararhodobacter sp.]
MSPVQINRGDGPVLLAMPHTGTYLPPEIGSRLNADGLILADTDWHIHRLYDGLLPGATVVRACFHRYVIDANRPPDGASLYPGQNTTGLIPLSDFDGKAIWKHAPEAADARHRLEAYHAPYHATLRAEISRIRDRHGVAILFDCHSIRSHIPRLFEGRLPDLNIGTYDGVSCDPRISDAVMGSAAKAERYSHVLDGRFKGGWTTRHYGRPGEGIHAIQMELAQSTYLARESPPFAYDEARATALRPALAEILSALAQLAPELRG